MEDLFHDFKQAQLAGSGPLLATTINPLAPPTDSSRLHRIYNDSNSFSIASDVRFGLLDHKHTELRFSKVEGNAWVDVYVAYWKALGAILEAENAGLDFDWTKVYEAWKVVANALIRGYSSAGFGAWTVPCLYVAGKYLRAFAITADASSKEGGSNGNAVIQDDIVGESGGREKLEDAARVLNRVFTLCISDRAPIEESRKWGLYYVMNLLFKTYFKLNSITLSQNILRALEASRVDMPPMEAFPKSHIVTFKYYVGVIHFLEENYSQAQENLTAAYLLCHKSATRNKELTLTYLIPTHLLTTLSLPSPSLLAPHHHLSTLLSPLIHALRTGNLSAFDAALASGENEFVKRRIYLTLERGRDLALRNLLRRVYMWGGKESRVPVGWFGAALAVGANTGEGVEGDEVECLLANVIYKNMMKAYIARDRGLVVFSKRGDAFPGTGV